MWRILFTTAFCFNLLGTAAALPFADRARSQALGQALGLTTQQMQLIQPIVMEAASELRGVSESEASREWKQKRRKQIVESATQKIAPLLNADERAQLVEMLNSLSRILGGGL